MWVVINWDIPKCYGPFDSKRHGEDFIDRLLGDEGFGYEEFDCCELSDPEQS